MPSGRSIRSAAVCCAAKPFLMPRGLLPLLAAHRIDQQGQSGRAGVAGPQGLCGRGPTPLQHSSPRHEKGHRNTGRRADRPGVRTRVYSPAPPARRCRVDEQRLGTARTGPLPQIRAPTGSSATLPLPHWPATSIAWVRCRRSGRRWSSCANANPTEKRPEPTPIGTARPEGPGKPCPKSGPDRPKPRPFPR